MDVDPKSFGLGVRQIGRRSIAQLNKIEKCISDRIQTEKLVGESASAGYTRTTCCIFPPYSIASCSLFMLLCCSAVAD